MTAACLERWSINDGFGRLIGLSRAAPVAVALPGQLFYSALATGVTGNPN